MLCLINKCNLSTNVLIRKLRGNKSKYQTSNDAQGYEILIISLPNEMFQVLCPLSAHFQLSKGNEVMYAMYQHGTIMRQINCFLHRLLAVYCRHRRRRQQ